MAFIPINFKNDQDAAPTRTVWNGAVMGWKNAEDLRRFEGAINNVVKALTGKDLPPRASRTVSFQTRAAYDMFTNTFPQGQDSDAVLARLKEIEADAEAIRADLADEEPTAPSS